MSGGSLAVQPQGWLPPLISAGHRPPMSGRWRIEEAVGVSPPGGFLSSGEPDIFKLCNHAPPLGSPLSLDSCRV